MYPTVGFGCSWEFPSFPDYSGLSSSVFDCRQVFPIVSIVSKCLKVFRTVLEIARVSRSVHDCHQIFRSFLDRSRKSVNISKSPQEFLCAPSVPNLHQCSPLYPSAHESSKVPNHYWLSSNALNVPNWDGSRLFTSIGDCPNVFPSILDYFRVSSRVLQRSDWYKCP